MLCVVPRGTVTNEPARQRVLPAADPQRALAGDDVDESRRRRLRVSSAIGSFVCTSVDVALAVQPSDEPLDGALPMKLESIHDSKLTTLG